MKEEKSFFKLMQKVPGGLIIVPMLIGVLANTFIPNVLGDRKSTRLNSSHLA